MNYKPFRQWVYDIWQENCEEYLTSNQIPYILSEYFNKYKYWLKREYRHQRSQHDNAS